MHKRWKVVPRMPRGVARLGISATLAGAVLWAGPASAQQVRLLETGSTLLYPLFNLWVAEYGKSHSDVQITTQGTGSGTGISQAISGVAQIGASDAYMSDAQIKTNQGMLNIPLAISSQMVNYNVEGLNGAGTHLKLSGPALAAIYNGSAMYWDDKAIASLNPGVKLPHDQIVPVHRSDGSGDTFIFTQYLSASSPDWSNSVAYGTTVSWPPVQGGVGAQGNPGMVNAAKGTPGSIAYIGISFKNATSDAKLGEAELQNKDGKFVLPTPRTVQDAVEATVANTPPDERLSLIFAAGPEAYPIINYEYAIIKSQQPDAQQAAALKAFLEWAISKSGGASSKFLNQVGFVPLPAKIAALSKKQIDMIH